MRRSLQEQDQHINPWLIHLIPGLPSLKIQDVLLVHNNYIFIFLLIFLFYICTYVGINSAFSQQRLRGWRPILTPYNVLPTLLLFAAIFIPIGITLLFTSSRLVEVSADYTACLDRAPSSFSPLSSGVSWRKSGPSECQLQLTIPHDIKGPVFVYYHLTNFYQNNRLYVKSVEWKQLGGAALSTSQLKSCSPLIGNGSLPYYPCGLIANSFFSDAFGPLLNEQGQAAYEVSQEGIAWSSDTAKYAPSAYGSGQAAPPPAWVAAGLYTDHMNADGTQWLRIPDLSANQRLMVWMRTAAFPSFRKIYGRLQPVAAESSSSGGNTDLPAGTYTLSIKSTFPVQGFNGTKSIVIGNVGFAGSKNSMLGWAFVFTGCLFAAAFVVLFLRYTVVGRRLGDRRILSNSSRHPPPAASSNTPNQPVVISGNMEEREEEDVDPDALVDASNTSSTAAVAQSHSNSSAALPGTATAKP